MKKAGKNKFSISHKVITRPLGAVLVLGVLSLQSFAGDRVIIDAMDDWWILATPTAPHRSTHTVESGANRIRYELDENGWIALVRENAGLLDASCGDSISFWARGSGYSNNLQFQIKDKDGRVNRRSFKEATSHTSWRKYVVPFSFLDSGDDGPVDTAAISEIGFAVTPYFGRYGSVTVDGIASFSLRSGSTYTVSGYDLGYPPKEGGWSNEYASVNASFDSENAYEGEYCIRIEYDLPAPPLGEWSGGGYWLKLGGNPAGIDGFYELRFMARSGSSGKSFKVELQDVNDSLIASAQLADHLAGLTTTSWQEVRIPLGAGAGNFNLDSAQAASVRKLVIAIVNGEHAAEGTLYLDNIKFVSNAAASPAPEVTYDSMDLPWQVSGWKNYGRDADLGITSTELESAPGLSGRAVRLNYEFKRTPADESDWVVMDRDWGLNLSTATHLGFSYKGIAGRNNLEFKIQDKNGTIYWRKFFSAADTGGEWKNLIIPLREFSLFEKGSYGEVDFDLAKLNKFDFALSGEEGTSGDVFIKDLSVYFSSDFTRTRRGKIIEELKVTKNPFSPNDDGLNDTTAFVFRLSRAAEVKLEIFSTDGGLVYEEDSGYVPEGVSLSIEWDGRKTSGRRVSNGMYFYRLRASAAGSSDSVTHLIAVIR